MSFDSDNEKEETLIYMTYDENGYPVWHSQMTSEENTERATCIVPPDHVLPVIFIPGIMGSNLRTKGGKYGDTGDEGRTWRPDDSNYTALEFGKKNPAERRATLDPEKSELDDRGEIKIPGVFINTLDGPTSDKIKHGLKEEFRRRRWGTVMLSSYQDIMINLEVNLNRIYDPQYHQVQADIARYWKKDIIDFEQKSNNICWNMMILGIINPI